MNRDTPRLNVPADAIDVEDLRDARPGAIIYDTTPKMNPIEEMEYATWKYLVLSMKVDGFHLQHGSLFVNEDGLRVDISPEEAQATATDAIGRLTDRRVREQRDLP